MPPRTFEGFVERLRDVRDEGYLRTHRRGDTGIGKTLEDLLGIAENNVPGPDAVGVELKSTRKRNTSLTTLFTKEPPRDRRRLWGADLVRTLGYVDDHGRRALKVTVEPGGPNSRGFSLSYGPGSVSVDHASYGTCASYPLEVLRRTFERKLPELVMVLADTKVIDGVEHFWYNEAYHLSGFDPARFLELMRDGNVTLDLRMHLKESGRCRNHGTAWRILDDSQLVRAFDARTPLLRDGTELGRID